MVTIFSLNKNLTKLTARELSDVLSPVYAYSNTEDGKWLKDINYIDYEYYWKEDWRDGYIQAARPLFGNKIILQPYSWTALAAPPAVHELRHIWQRKKYGIIIYSILSLISKIPGLYEKAPLEKDAFIHQDNVSNLIR